jgi:hypothetical protein
VRSQSLDRSLILRSLELIIEVVVAPSLDKLLKEGEFTLTIKKSLVGSF